MSNEKTVLMLIAGPSLTGKSRLAQLLAEHGTGDLISTTTRAMREGEVNGKHYNFVTKEGFSEMVANGEMVEHVKHGQYHYGTSSDDMARAFGSGRPIVKVCEVEGVRSLHEHCKKMGWDTCRVFVNNPERILLERFLERFRNDGKATISDYVERLENMLGKEKREWIEPALSGRDGYDIIVDEFTPETEPMVLARLLGALGLGQDKCPQRACKP